VELNGSELDTQANKLVSEVVSFARVESGNLTHKLHDHANECNMIALGG
jgi:hypothetical protein